MTTARILSIGDSISMGYREALSAALADIGAVERPATNCSDSRTHIANMACWVGNTAWDVIIFNCGLHDIKRASAADQNQVPLDEYGRNLQRIVSFLKPRATHLVWVTTTPVVDETHQSTRPFHRYTKDILRYNSLATAVMHTHRLPQCDLHTWVLTMSKEQVIGADGVHFTPTGYQGAGEFVAAFVRGLLVG